MRMRDSTLCEEKSVLGPGFLLARGYLWSRWQISQEEALPLHLGLADACDCPKFLEVGDSVCASPNNYSPFSINNYEVQPSCANHSGIGMVYMLFQSDLEELEIHATP